MEAEKITQALSAANGVVYFEDPAELTRLLGALREMYRPAGPVEDFLVEQMAGAQWSIRRYRRVLTGLLDYQTAIAAERLQMERQQDHARADSAIHQQNTTLMGVAFHLDCREDRAQLSLHRALMDLDRAYHRALKGLEAAQARRAKVSARVESRPATEPVTVSPQAARHAAVAVNGAPQPSEAEIRFVSRVTANGAPDYRGNVTISPAGIEIPESSGRLHNDVPGV